MPRAGRGETGGLACHVLNRGNGRATVFHDEDDYAAFVELLGRACVRTPMRVLGFCLMPNHRTTSTWSSGRGPTASWRVGCSG